MADKKVTTYEGIEVVGVPEAPESWAKAMWLVARNPGIHFADKDPLLAVNVWKGKWYVDSRSEDAAEHERIEAKLREEGLEPRRVDGRLDGVL